MQIYHGLGLYLLCIAREKDFDVVLIDTAGRMQDNEVSVCHIGLYGVANDFVLFRPSVCSPLCVRLQR